ncbi:MAG TPA: ABC transporter substrate-binding protein, partial [Baekduia sp.]|nr:ABC transporter substrate-binding protein [Baekduia sp.]
MIAVTGQPTALAVGAGSVWVSGAGGRTVSRIDPQTNSVTATIPSGSDPGALTYGAGALWVANGLHGTISRIDPSSNAVTSTIEVGDGAAAIAIAGGSIWVTNESGASLVEVDPRRGSVVRTIKLGGRPGAMSTAGGRLWVGVRDAGPNHRGGTLVLLNPAPKFDSIDPAIQYNVLPAQLLGMTNDGLVTFKHVGSRDGTQLVPDLANSLPSPADNGRSYTFHLRSGIRYSNRAPVRAGDIRRGIERVFKVNGPARSYYTGIVGGRRCARKPRRCDLSRGIVADDRRGAITFNLTAPDADFLYKLALPFAYAIPAGTPDRDVGRYPVPATGPYMIASYRAHHELRLVRNPAFREWSSAAQPDGYADEIVWKLGVTPEAGTSAVIHGRADWMLSIGQALPVPRLRDLERLYPSQLHVNPLMQTDYMILNVNTPPFDDIRVRRAVNYALDRRAITRLFGSSGAQPTCQVLPPQMPGYVRYCPYTNRGSHDGAWRAPDLTTAQRLVADSGTRRMKVVVWDTPGPERSSRRGAPPSRCFAA